MLAERYRELLDGSAGDRRGSTGELPATAVATVAEALDLLRSASEALVRNPDEKLLLQNLLLHLPRLEPARVRPSGAAGRFVVS